MTEQLNNEEHLPFLVRQTSSLFPFMFGSFIFASFAIGLGAFLRDSHEAPQEAIFKYCAVFDDSAFHIAFFRALGSRAASGSQRPPKPNKNCPVNNSVMERF